MQTNFPFSCTWYEIPPFRGCILVEDNRAGHGKVVKFAKDFQSFLFLAILQIKSDATLPPHSTPAPLLKMTISKGTGRILNFVSFPPVCHSHQSVTYLEF